MQAANASPDIICKPRAATYTLPHKQKKRKRREAADEEASSYHTEDEEDENATKVYNFVLAALAHFAKTAAVTDFLPCHAAQTSHDLCSMAAAGCPPEVGRRARCVLARARALSTHPRAVPSSRCHRWTRR